MGELDGYKSSCPTRRKLFNRDTVITAEDAKKRAENNSKILVESELSEVYQAVFEASGKGLYEVNVNKILSNDALNRLTEIGYKHEPIGINSIDNGFEQRGHKISWK